MERFRVKGPRPGYRRAARVFGPDWTDVAVEDLSDAQTVQLLEDRALVIEQPDREGEKGVWTPIPAEDREAVAARYRAQPVVAGGEGEAEPDAALGRDLKATIELHREMLEGRGLWPVTVPQALFLSFAGLLGTAEGNVKRLTAELEALKQASPPKKAPAPRKPAAGQAD